MNDPWMLAFVIALFALQLCLCAKARRVWLRLLPLMVLLARLLSRYVPRTMALFQGQRMQISERRTQNAE